jgi:hypothetical protein
LTSLAVGFQQWYFKFCVGFGMKGLFNFKDIGTTSSVEETEMRKADKKKALTIIISGITISLILSMLFYLFP